MKSVVPAVLLALLTVAGPLAAADGASPPTTQGATMKITTFYATETGESRFRDIEIPFVTQRDDGFGHTLWLSNAYTSPNVQFVELPAGLDQDWHNAPARQVVVVLSGTLEVETTDGERRRWQAGHAFLPADVTGRGHRTRCIDGPVRVMFAPLADDFDISTWSKS